MSRVPSTGWREVYQWCHVPMTSQREPQLWKRAPAAQAQEQMTATEPTVDEGESATEESREQTVLAGAEVFTAPAEVDVDISQPEGSLVRLKLHNGGLDLSMDMGPHEARQIGEELIERANQTSH